MQSFANPIQIYVIIAAFALMLAGTLVAFNSQFFANTTQQIAINNGVLKLAEREQIFQDFLTRSESHLNVIEQSIEFKDFLNSKASPADLSSLMMTLVKANPAVMQLRYVDHRGDEKVRVERFKVGESPQLTPQANLQNESHRYYFKVQQQRTTSKVWYSALNLNVEYQQVEAPYKPIIKLVLPVRQENEWLGLLSINLFMQDFVTRLSQTPLYDMVLFDSSGQVLHHHQEAKAWSAYSENKPSMRHLYPDYASNLMAEGLQINQTFVAKKLDIPVEGGLHMLLSIKPPYVEQIKQDSESKNTAIMVFVALFSLLAAITLVKLFNRKAKAYEHLEVLNNKLLAQSTTDYLTQLKNPKAFKKELDQLIAEFTRYGKGFSIVMLDIDGLKAINNKYGLAVGDEVLTHMAQLFADNLRLSDSAYRFSGDEFMVLMPDTDRMSACHIAKRLCQQAPQKLTEQIAELESVTISIGVTSVILEDSRDRVIQRVDANLEKAKLAGKNQVSC